MRVAWVDDVEVIRLIGQCLIERSGGSCVVFEDHASLLASRAGPFDAAVLQPSDVVPADTARIELRRRGVDIILLASGDTAESWSQAGIDLAAFDGFLAKPFTFGELREALGLVADRGEVAS